MKPDPLIERETRALSPETKAAVSQVDDLIKGLEARKAEMRFESTNDITGRINALRDKKQKLLAGEIDETLEAPALAPAPQSLRLPVDMAKSKDPVTNPFNAIDVLPTEDSELRPILKQAMEFGLHHVNALIADYRTIAGKHQNTPVVYSQGEHVALRATLATLWTETRQLFKFAREKRQELEGRVQSLEGKQEVYERAMQANRHIAGVLMKRLEGVEAGRMTYAGVWAAGEYQENNIVTHQGSSWICRRATDQPPGDGDTWSLMTKRGRDGKDKDSR